MCSLAEKLRIDRDLLARELPVSDCGVKAPRLNSSRDRSTGVAHATAFELFPLEGKKPEEVEKIYSYIQYQQLLSRLTKAYKAQVAKAEAVIEEENKVKDLYRQARAYGNKETFEALLEEPIQEPILEPTPMPVEIAPKEELQPFFDHMQKKVPAKQECEEFTRGAYYDDGRIDMCKQVVGDTWIGNFVDSIKGNAHVKHFLMGNNVVDLEGAQRISKFIKENSPEIETWYLAGNKIDTNGAKLLAQAFVSDHYCKALWLKRNPLKENGVYYIGKMLENNSTIEILDLVNVGAMDEGITHLFKSLTRNQSLRYLYLDANGITEQGALEIAGYFEYLKHRKKTGITSLCLAINRLGDEGAIILAHALAKYKCLERLDLASNRIQAKGLEAILDAVQDHPKLIYLDLGLYKSTSDMKELPNYFGDEGANLIADFIRTNKHVKIMSVQDTNIGPEGLEKIADALDENNTLLYLYFGQYGYCTPKELRERMWKKMEQNIQRELGDEVTLDIFRKDHLRIYKHTQRVKDIDSIYRNNM